MWMVYCIKNLFGPHLGPFFRPFLEFQILRRSGQALDELIAEDAHRPYIDRFCVRSSEYLGGSIQSCSADSLQKVRLRRQTEIA